MNEGYPVKPEEITHDVMPFDELAQYLEGAEHEDQKLSAINKAVSELAELDDIEKVAEGLGDITGIALEHGIEPDVVESLYHQAVAELPEEQ